MVEARQLLMSVVRQFKDNLESSKAISKNKNKNKKTMALGWDSQLGQGVKCLCLHWFLFSRIELHLDSVTFLSLASEEKREVFSVCTSLKCV